MINVNTRIQILDVATGFSDTLTLDDVVMKYYTHIKTIGGIKSIEFGNEDVKVRDLTGWTTLLRLIIDDGAKYAAKFNRLGNKWYKVSNITDINDPSYSEIIVTSNQTFPIYTDIENPDIGFHGERVQKYTLKDLWTINCQTDYIRISNTEDHIEFVHPIVTEYFDNRIGRSDIGVHLCTKSGLCTVNNIYCDAVDKNYPFERYTNSLKNNWKKLY